MSAQGKENMVFAGTAVANGAGVAIVNAIGMRTEIGHIQQQIQAAAAEEDDTPLKKKLDEFGELLAKARLSPPSSIDINGAYLRQACPCSLQTWWCPSGPATWRASQGVTTILVRCRSSPGFVCWCGSSTTTTSW